MKFDAATSSNVLPSSFFLISQLTRFPYNFRSRSLPSLRRHILGILALSSLLAGFWLLLRPQIGDYPQLDGILLRVGTLLGVIWLAYDQVERLPGWLMASVPFLFLLLAAKPRWFLYALPLVLILAILKPRIGSRRRKG
jgi:hypothetical protein